MPQDNELFEQIIYVPGNHDHHLWEVARETQYENYVKTVNVSSHLDIPWHVSRLFDDPKKRVPITLLTTLVQRHQNLKQFSIKAAYPNFGLVSDDRQKCVLFHHGHFIEPIYRLMSFALDLVFPNKPSPIHIWQLEEENFAWIDFFWSALGRSGNVGRGVEAIYEKIQDPKNFKILLSELSRTLANRYDLPGWGDKMEASLLKLVFHGAVEKLNNVGRKHKGEGLLSVDTQKGLWAYMNGPMKDQILNECSRNMPRDLTFVFGHTHMPFEEDMNFQGYPQWANVYNTGGWVADVIEPELQKRHGASIVMVDDNLDAVAIRMYNQVADISDYAVRVMGATHRGEQSSPFFKKMTKMVAPSKEPWKSFSEEVARDVHIRVRNLQARINETE